MGAAANIASSQLLGTQSNVALSFIKQNAQVEEALVNMIVQSSSSGGLGQNVDLTV